jgi:hypothetical protein
MLEQRAPCPSMIIVEALYPAALSFFFPPPRRVLLVDPAFGRLRRCRTASTLRATASSLDSEHPSPERVVAGQPAPFARGYHAGTASRVRLIDRVYHAGTASTLRLRDHRRSTLPPRPLPFFCAPARVLLVYPAFGRVRRCWTASTLRPSASPLDSEHPSPECVVAAQRAPAVRGYHAETASTLRLIDRVCHAGSLSDHRRSTLPSGPCIFCFFSRPRWGPTAISSLRPSASSLHSECVVAGQRALFARVRRRWTTSTLRPRVSCWNSEHPSPDR